MKFDQKLDPSGTNETAIAEHSSGNISPFATPKNATEASTPNITQANNQASNNQKEEGTSSKDEKKFARYLELYKATMSGNWQAAERVFVEDPGSLTAPIDDLGGTVLHLAAVPSSDKMVFFLQQLTDFMEKKGISLKETNNNSHNALHYAAKAGNPKAAMLLLKKDPTLLTQQQDDSWNSPLQIGARLGHEQIIRHLLPVTRLQNPGLFAGYSGFFILEALILNRFYDIAIELLERCPGLAVVKNVWTKDTALHTMAREPDAFPSGRRVAFWERLLYHVWDNPLVNNLNSPQKKDIEDPVLQRSETCWKFFPLFRIFKKFNGEKKKHKQLLQLLRSLVEKVAKSEEPLSILGPCARIAAEAGIHEFVEEVIKAYPHVLLSTDDAGRNIFHVAIIRRQEKIFNLLFQLGEWKHFAMQSDDHGNTMLHLAANLEPHSSIEKIPGAALQMQREWQWYKAVEELVSPWHKTNKNGDKNIPETLFSESHKKLVEGGHIWMKDTANFYSIIAALVVTVTFAAAFTAPGGNKGDSGLPIFLNDTFFMVYAMANTLALFSSATSLLMFLGILTSRYSPEEFHRALPTKLVIGQITLFLAIASMVIAFGASVYLVLSHRFAWIIVPIGLLACVPLSLFLLLQFPLLVEVAWSTFGPSIIRKQSDNKLME